jgi:NAD(P)-dependent dehydrogenase (short-subunit alcohol dehydrogenase family)
MQLTDRTVLVTGGASGLGLATGEMIVAPAGVLPSLTSTNRRGPQPTLPAVVAVSFDRYQLDVAGSIPVSRSSSLHALPPAFFARA